jgi:hypothetical protein
MCAAVLMAGFAGCSREIVIDEGKPGKVGKDGLPTYATFNFVVSGGSNTKASSDMTDDKNEKNSVTDIRLIIFKTGASSVCEVNESYDNASASAPNAWDEKQSKTVQLTSGEKKIFVITNTEKKQDIHQLLSGIQVGSTTLNQFYDMVYRLHTSAGGPVSDVDGLKKLVDATNGYVMSNAMSSNATFDLKGGIGLDESRKGSGDALKNNFVIDIQRSVAKVSVYYDQTDVLKTVDKVGALKNPEYVIRNVNSATYLFQKFASDAVDASVKTNIPRSPYYSLPSGVSYDTIYYKDFNFIKVGTSNTAPKVYVSENTSEVPRNATVTYAAIKAEFLPSKDLIVQDYAYNELTTAFHSVQTMTQDLTTATTLYRLVDVGPTTGLAANVFFTDRDKAYKAAYLIEYNSEKGFSTSNLSVLDWDGKKGYIVEYDKGLCYYRLDLGDNANGAIIPGIRRNHAYAARITSFSTIGMPKLEDLDKDPEKPIGQKTHVTATIKITDWTDVTSDHNL